MTTQAKRLLKPEDFEVEECVTQHYQHEIWQEHPGKWFWHCLTCDTGSGKRWRHRRGHKLESSAHCAAKYHRNQMKRNRQLSEHGRWWWNVYMNTDDVDLFFSMYRQRFPEIHIRDDMTREEVMRHVQKGLLPDAKGEDRFLEIGASRILRTR